MHQAFCFFTWLFSCLFTSQTVQLVVVKSRFDLFTFVHAKFTMYSPPSFGWLLDCNQTPNRVNSHFLPHEVVHVTSCAKIGKHSLSLLTAVKFLEWTDLFRLYACTLGVRRRFDWKARGSPFFNSLIPQEAQLTSFIIVITIHITVIIMVIVIDIIIIQFLLIFAGAHQSRCWPHHTARRRFEKW